MGGKTSGGFSCVQQIFIEHPLRASIVLNSGCSHEESGKVCALK